MPRAIRALAAGVAAAAVAAACSSTGASTAYPRHRHHRLTAPTVTTVPPTGGSSTSPTAPSATGAAVHTWIFAKAAFEAVVADATAASRLRHDKVYEILHDAQTPTPGFDVVPTLGFTSYYKMQSDLASGAVPSYVKAVLYDSEKWEFTPPDEQLHPDTYYGRAAAAAHAHGLQLVATPAMDLTQVLGSATHGDTPAAFLQLGVLGQTAAVSDVVDIQAQRLANASAGYATFVSQAVSQVRSANPGAVILAGLSTCAGGSPSAAQLVQAADESARYVSGWWMNVPSGGPSSPGCGTPRTDVAIQFVDQLPGY